MKELDSINRLAVSQLEELLGFQVGILPLVPVSSREHIASYMPGASFLLVSLRSIGCAIDPHLNLALEYPSNYKWHRKQGIVHTPQEFLTEVLCHEYWHYVFDNYYRGLVRAAAIANSPGLARPIVRGIDEAAAFWVVDKISGHSHLWEEQTRYYKAFGDECPTYLQFFHNLFHSLSSLHGNKYIIDNFAMIVACYLPKVSMVKLPIPAAPKTN